MLAPIDQYDLLIYGATGLLGRKTVRALVEDFDQELAHLKVALIAPDIERLEKVASTLRAASHHVDCFALSSYEDTKLSQLAAEARCVISTAGPYVYYSEPILAGVAVGGGIYLDASGEGLWMFDMAVRYGDLAKDSGALVIQAVGYCGLPADFGVAEFQRRQIAAFGHPSSRIEGRVEAAPPQLRDGLLTTTRSIVEQLRAKPSRMAQQLDDRIFALSYEQSGEPDEIAPVYDPAMGSWSAPSIVGKPDQQVVWRTNVLQGLHYGEDFNFKIRVMTGDGESGQESAQRHAGTSFALSPDEIVPTEIRSIDDPKDDKHPMNFWFYDPDRPDELLCMTCQYSPCHASAARYLAHAAIYSLNRSEMPVGFHSPVSGLGLGFLDYLVDREIMALEWMELPAEAFG